MNSVPEPWEFALLALAAWRTWKLIGDDVILDRPRAWAVRRLGSKFDELITCPYCAGFWISVGWWGAWLIWPRASLIAAVPLAISAIVGLVGSILNVLSR